MASLSHVQHASQAAGDAEKSVENKLDHFNTEMWLNPHPEQEAEQSPVLPITASPSWDGFSLQSPPSTVTRHRNVEVLKEGRVREESAALGEKNSIAHSAVKLLMQEV